MTDRAVAVRSSEGPFEAAHEIRRRVFVDEQDIEPSLEFDDRDDEATHFLATIDGDPAGTARVRFLDERTARVERVAVISDHRGTDVGRRLMDVAHEFASERGRSRTLVHAQARTRVLRLARVRVRPSRRRRDAHPARRDGSRNLGPALAAASTLRFATSNANPDPSDTVRESAPLNNAVHLPGRW